MMSMTGVFWCLGVEHVHHTSSPNRCQDLIKLLHVGTCQVNDVCLALLGQRQHSLAIAIATTPDENIEGVILSPSFRPSPFAIPLSPGLLPRPGK